MKLYFSYFIHCNHDKSLCWNNYGRNLSIKLQILLVIFSKNRSLVIFPLFMIMALKVSRINLCLLKKKKSSWESYLISIRTDNPVPIWQKHCSPSNKTIRKGLERKMSALTLWLHKSVYVTTSPIFVLLPFNLCLY